MMQKKIMLIKPAYETDAVWDTIRTSQPLGLWWIGSNLKKKGHEVRLLDETVRDGGLEEKVMFRRELVGDKITDYELGITTLDKIKEARAMPNYDRVIKKKGRRRISISKPNHLDLIKELGVGKTPLLFFSFSRI